MVGPNWKCLEQHGMGDIQKAPMIQGLGLIIKAPRWALTKTTGLNLNTLECIKYLLKSCIFYIYVLPILARKLYFLQICSSFDLVDMILNRPTTCKKTKELNRPLNVFFQRKNL